MDKELAVIVSMKPWWDDVQNLSPIEQHAYNQAVIRCAEAIRRYDDYDEKRALFLHRLLIRPAKSARRQAQVKPA